MTSAMPELKPCPACGSTNVYFGEHAINVFCDNCSMSGPAHIDDDKAIELWNAMPRRLKYTDEKPTVPGRYWYKDNIIGSEVIVHVVYKGVNNILTAMYVGNVSEKVANMHGKWSGRIEKPLSVTVDQNISAS